MSSTIWSHCADTWRASRLSAWGHCACLCPPETIRVERLTRPHAPVRPRSSPDARLRTRSVYRFEPASVRRAARRRYPLMSGATPGAAAHGTAPMASGGRAGLGKRLSRPGVGASRHPGRSDPARTGSRAAWAVWCAPWHRPALPPASSVRGIHIEILFPAPKMPRSGQSAGAN